MRLFFVIFIFSQLFNFLVVFADKVKRDSDELNSVKWEKVQKKKSNNLKKIIWKSYNNDYRIFQNEIDIRPAINNLNDYRNEDEDKYQQHLYERDNLLNYGGILLGNALIPKAGTSQINLDYDSKGNLFGFYSYSLSNRFQLELSAGSFNDVNLVDNKHSSLQSKYMSRNNLNYRIGGKFVILSPKNYDPFWMTFRMSVGSSDQPNQGYLITELISTFKLNDRVAINLSPKYFFSEIESIGALGVSSYINLIDKLQLIPEINPVFTNGVDFISSIGLRYSFEPGKSIDLYYSNAAGIQDIGQFFEDNEYRFGIKLNFIY